MKLEDGVTVIYNVMNIKLTIEDEINKMKQAIEKIKV